GVMATSTAPASARPPPQRSAGQPPTNARQPKPSPKRSKLYAQRLSLAPLRQILPGTLLLEEQVVHAPELILCSGALGRNVRAAGIRVDVDDWEVQECQRNLIANSVFELGKHFERPALTE